MIYADLLNPNPALLESFQTFFMIITVGCAIVFTVFTVIYFSLFPWWITVAGRIQLSLTTALAATFTVVCLARLFGPDYALRSLVTLAVYPAVLITGCLLVLTLVQRYRSGQYTIFHLMRDRRKLKK